MKSPGVGAVVARAATRAPKTSHRLAPLLCLCLFLCLFLSLAAQASAGVHRPPPWAYWPDADPIKNSDELLAWNHRVWGLSFVPDTLPPPPASHSYLIWSRYWSMYGSYRSFPAVMGEPKPSFEAWILMNGVVDPREQFMLATLYRWHAAQP